MSATRAGIGGHHRTRGRREDYVTPLPLIQALGQFDFDPCCPPTMPWPTAKEMIHQPRNGLLMLWKGRVWLNPPYGEQLGQWLANLASHGNGIALTFARTETAAFFDHVWPDASAVCFLRRRLRFHAPDGTLHRGTAGGPSVLIAYGQENANSIHNALERRRLDGFLVRLGR